ncbi:MAG: zinc-ribbon domain-containing protein [Victivallales bacterium]|jgi:hypothetical protein|nr:zinc-ribbon domain-containing protein [Victivallales bacterium]
MPQPIDPGHNSKRAVLRVVGPCMVAIGLIFVAIGLVSFFSAFGGGGPPKYFWCAFIGLPMTALGGTVCMFAFMGAVGRYGAAETAPVAKDTINYMADGTKGAMRTMATAMGEGLRSGMNAADAGVQRCPSCGESNEANAKFCKSCGVPMAKACGACGEANDPDAKFCDNCGGKLA